MISMTTVARIGERDVFVLVIANPVLATIGFCEVLAFAAKAASMTCWVLDGKCFGHGSVLEARMGLKYRKLVRLPHSAQAAALRLTSAMMYCVLYAQKAGKTPFREIGPFR